MTEGNVTQPSGVPEGERAGVNEAEKVGVLYHDCSDSECETN